MNSNLSQQNFQMQNKQSQLEDDIKTLKKYKKIVNNSMALQCKHCMSNLAKENFQEHIQSCMKEQDRNRASYIMPQGGIASPFGPASLNTSAQAPNRYSTMNVPTANTLNKSQMVQNEFSIKPQQYQPLYDQSKFDSTKYQKDSNLRSQNHGY